MKITRIVAACSFLLSFYPSLSTGADRENAPLLKENLSTLIHREIKVNAGDESGEKRMSAAKHLSVKVSQGEQGASDLLMKLANSMRYNEANTAYHCLRFMVRDDPEWAKDNFSNFLFKDVDAKRGWPKFLRAIFTTKQKESNLVPDAPLQALGIGAQFLINCKLGVNSNSVELFVKDFLIGLCASENESHRHLAAQIIAGHCYVELGGEHYGRKDLDSELVRWPGRYLVELFESQDPCKQLICYAALVKIASNLKDLAMGYQKSSNALLKPLLSTPNDESFAALLVATYRVNNMPTSDSFQEVFEFSEGFEEKVKALEPGVELIKAKYQEFPRFPSPDYKLSSSKSKK